MIKQEIYDALEFLETIKDTQKDSDYWKAVAYLYYSDDNILNHEDKDFTNRLIKLINDTNNQSSAECCWPCQQNYYKYALSPEKKEERDFKIEFFPTALCKTLKF